VAVVVGDLGRRRLERAPHAGRSTRGRTAALVVIVERAAIMSERKLVRMHDEPGETYLDFDPRRSAFAEARGTGRPRAERRGRRPTRVKRNQGSRLRRTIANPGLGQGAFGETRGSPRGGGHAPIAMPASPPPPMSYGARRVELAADVSAI